MKMPRRFFCEGVASTALIAVAETFDLENVPPIGTVGRRRAKPAEATASKYESEGVSLYCGDSLSFYDKWESPTVIV